MTAERQAMAGSGSVTILPVPAVRSGPMLQVGVLALGVADVRRAARFWCAALGYELRTDGFGGWATVLVPRS
jgi:hypothetical protein